MEQIRQDKETIEQIVDRHGLSTIINMLSEICYEKEEHIATNWQDMTTARVWRKAANEIEKVKVPDGLQ